jgi:hypothetical protein
MPVYFDATAFAAMAALAAPSVSAQQRFIGNASASMSAQAEPTLTQVRVSGIGGATMTGIATPRTLSRFRGTGLATVNGKALTNQEVTAISVEVAIRAVGTGSFNLPEQGMNLSDVGRQIYNLWGLEITSTKATTFARSRVVEIINAAMQTIYGRAVALDYFNRTTATLTFAMSEDAKTLPTAMQTLLGPVRFADSKQPLRPAATRSELDEFVDLYYGGVAPAFPRMYFLDRGFVDGVDAAGATLRISPAPAAEISLEVEYAQEPPRYTESDLISGVPLRIPHRYVESILLPMAKHMAASDRMFTRESLRGTLQGDYTRAMQQLGLVDPERPTVRNAKPKEATTA